MMASEPSFMRKPVPADDAELKAEIAGIDDWLRSAWGKLEYGSVPGLYRNLLYYAGRLAWLKHHARRRKLKVR